MREMTADEMRLILDRCNWATICTCSESGAPYAVEATPYRDGDDYCFMINPRGGTWANVQANPNVLLKFTLTSRNLSWWAGVSCHGTGAFEYDPQAIRDGFAALGEVMGQDYSAAGERFAGMPDRSPLFRVRVSDITGRCSAAEGETLTGSTLDAAANG